MEKINSNNLNTHEEDPDIPPCLIVANVPDSVFENTREDRRLFEKMFTNFGAACFVYLKSFRRVLINYESSGSAALAKLSLHFSDFKEQELKVYFRKVIIIFSYFSLIVFRAV